MRRYQSGDRERDFRKGKRALARHRPDLALRGFRTAADSCPAARAGELARYLYWLAVALLRLDKPELALKSLASAQKLRPKGHARSAYLARINDYGMTRRASPELDDFYAYYSVQACSYLNRKRSGRFDSNAEKDAITRLIGEAWRSLSQSGALAGKSPGNKFEYFKNNPIEFPFLSIGAPMPGRVIAADFRRGSRLKAEDPCSCGSGLRYILCCGRGSTTHEAFCE